jgi:hypothetical protein
MPHPYDREKWDRIWDRSEAKRRAFYANPPLYVDRQHRRYFHGFLHDSPLLGLKKQGQKLVLSFQIDLALGFAEKMDNLLGMDAAEGPWPVHVVAHGTEDFRLVDHDVAGRLHTVTLPAPYSDGKIPPVALAPRLVNYSYGPGSQWFAPPALIHDFGRRVADRVEWLVYLSWVGWGLVDCARLTARDESRPRIAQTYGPTIGLCY